MGLLFRILKRLYRIGSRVIQNSLIDDPYYEYNVLLVLLANVLIVITIFSSIGFVLYMLVWLVSLEIFLGALLIAYWLAWYWEQFANELTSFAQEMYLICSTLGNTVGFGTLIQIHRMQWADGNTLLVYWIFLLILGFILWAFTVSNAARARAKPVLAIKNIEYKQRFRITKTPEENSTTNQVQAYLKKLK